MLDEKQFLFIIGSPRSGTTMLQVLLGSHPKVASTVELTLFDRYIGPWLSVWNDETAKIRNGNWDQGLPMLWDQGEFDDFIREFLNRAYGKLGTRFPDATHILDKHPGYSLHVPAIRRFLPQARFIHIIRDGRDVACSLRAAKRTMGFGMDRVSDAASRWRKMVIAAREAAAYGEGAYLELRYEDFLEDSATTFGRILDFCGLPWDQEWLLKTIEANQFDRMKERRATGDPTVKCSEHHYRRGKAGSWAEELSKSDRYEFDRYAGDLLSELGYSKADWWAESRLQELLEPLLYNWRAGRRTLLDNLKRSFPNILGSAQAPKRG